MAMKPEPLGPIPAETERVAHAAFPRGNRAMQMRDRLGWIYDDARVADLFAVRGRIDWTYLLGLPLEDPGFAFSGLSEFRTRLVAGNAEHLLLDALLTTCKVHGLLRARGRQRTDPTHVLGSLRTLHR